MWVSGCCSVPAPTPARLLPVFRAWPRRSVRVPSPVPVQASRASLGSHIGTVMQPALLLNTTIRESIAFAKPHASDEEVAHAARRSSSWRGSVH